MKNRITFYCTNCGNEYPKWQGKCTACGSWNTIVEQPAQPKKSSPATGARQLKAQPQQIDDVELTEELRFRTGMNELDRVLGGGAVQGSLVLIGGAPGIGKSTLMLQICNELCKEYTVLYVSGEESARQIKLRAARLNVSGETLYLFSETDLGNITDAVHQVKPDILIVDSIQTISSDASDSIPGSVAQVKQCTMALMELAKGEGLTVFVIGHINKEGSIAGPKVLEHMVDCVLSFEGEQQQTYRILRAVKNRFGATNEIGVFEMLDEGLTEVPNPSELLLSGRPAGAPGTCVTCVMEGARPVLAEVQALVTTSSFANPRRTSNGVEYGRAVMLIAVLERRGGLNIGNCDSYINVIGGLNLEEPAADLATVLAIASSFRNKPVPEDLAAIGEVGLTGELRPVTALAQRLSEVHRLGFTKCMIPSRNSGRQPEISGLQLIPVKNIREAMAALL
ncbi:MAG: DNA repair protein RadA [Clostridiales bacterium]|nr:DNA repair protein RadA [Clostridiales bacterium]